MKSDKEDSTKTFPPLLRRAFLSLEDGEWERADEFCEQVLNHEPENAEAYLGKLMAELRVSRLEDLQNCDQSFGNNKNYEKVVRFGGDKYERMLSGYIDHINERNRKDAERAAKKRKKTIKIVTPIVCTCIILVILLQMVIIPKVIIPKLKYNAFVSKYGKEYADNFYYLNVGDVFKFGSYEQDNNTENGTEDIEWIVLKKEENDILAISKYSLDCQPFDTSNNTRIWMKSSIRKWLNETFLNAAFSESEQAVIKREIHYNEEVFENDYYYYDVDTRDYIFLLDRYEAKKYFGSDEARKCAPTDYAIAQGAFTSDTDVTDGRGSGPWLLRSPCEEWGLVEDVCADGSIYEMYIDTYNRSVRPALWIHFEY